MNSLVAFAFLALIASTAASGIGLGLGAVGLINPWALSPVGPSGIVTGAGAAGPRSRYWCRSCWTCWNCHWSWSCRPYRT
ncbi:hypothetical protein JTB14_021427 [Gonioctena quinquepunctata]|nr:hypothetical protein JTB14_021427 [Gonioctena quinquepunctata]